MQGGRVPHELSAVLKIRWRLRSQGQVQWCSLPIAY